MAAETEKILETQKRKNKKNDPNHLSFGKLMLWKSSDVSAAWVNVIALSYLSIYASNTLGLDIKLVGILLLLSKILDAITDLFAGILVDNTHTKLGKGRPYEISIVGQTICTILMFAVNPAWTNIVKYIWLFVTYMFTYSIFATLRVAANAPYTIRAFSNNQILIRKVASYGGIITMFCSIVVSIVFPTLVANIATSAHGWTTAVLLIMIPATLIGVLRFIFVKEDPSVDEQSKQEKINFREIGLLFSKNKYVWFYAIIMLAFNLITNLAVGTYFFQYVFGNMSMMSVFSALSMFVLPLMLTFPWIMRKMGSMCKMLICFVIVSIAGYFIVFLAGTSLPLLIVGGILASLATLPLSYYGVLFIMNICEYNEIIGLPRMDGSSQILSNLSSKAGAALGSFVTGIVLSVGGFISSTEKVTQPDSAILAIRVDYALIPVVGLAIILFGLLQFRKLEVILENKKAEKLKTDLKPGENTSTAV